MIKVDNVNKSFGSFTALKNVSFEVSKGEIVGFLGANGAGKTTLMRILTSYLLPTSGSVFIDGKNIKDNSILARQKIGYLPETPPLYFSMSVRGYLRFAAELKSIKPNQIKQNVNRVLNECQLEHVADKVIGTLSKGYKQRTGIAQAIIHDPEILILDEPTSGLDPIQNQHVRRLIESFKGKRTVIISTHILPEIELLAERVLMIKKGEIIINDLITNIFDQNKDVSNLEELFLKNHLGVLT